MNELKVMVFLIFVVFVATIPSIEAQAPSEKLSKLQSGVWQIPINKQVQIAVDVNNSQERDQSFAYLVQIRDQNGVVVQLSWITGTLTSGQSLNPSQSWTPTTPGNYIVEIFVWDSINNPDALSPPLSMNVAVT